MKAHRHMRFGMALLFLIFVVGLPPVMADPFLVSDPQPSKKSKPNGVELYQIMQTDANGNFVSWVEKSEPPDPLGDGTAQLKYDLASFQEKNATYYFQVRACNHSKDRRLQCSDWVPVPALRANFPWSPR